MRSTPACAQISLIVAGASTLLGGIIGVVVGLMSGYLLGWFDLGRAESIEGIPGLPAPGADIEIERAFLY